MEFNFNNTDFQNFNRTGFFDDVLETADKVLENNGLEQITDLFKSNGTKITFKINSFDNLGKSLSIKKVADEEDKKELKGPEMSMGMGDYMKFIPQMGMGKSKGN